MSKGAGTGVVSSSLVTAIPDDVANVVADDAWGLDADEDDEENKEVKKESEGDEGVGWDVGDEDIELPDDVQISNKNANEKGYFIPPTKGPSPFTIWISNSQLAADHVAAGSFESAFKLLHDQVI